MDNYSTWVITFYLVVFYFLLIAYYSAWAKIIYLVFIVICACSKTIHRLYVKALLVIFRFSSGKMDGESDASKSANAIIRPSIVLEPNGEVVARNAAADTATDDFFLLSIDYVKAGVEAVIQDEVLQRFRAEDLQFSWNLLTRTKPKRNLNCSIFWLLGIIFRYLLLVPSRMLIALVALLWLSLCTLLKEGPCKRKLQMACFNFFSCALAAMTTFHNKENRPKEGGICVANHTSPIDAMILHCDNSYAFVGQKHDGVLGFVQRRLSHLSSDHIWFERSEAKDREHVVRRLKEHADDPNRLPILIFPEGTCINNTSVMQFKKGTFEVGCVVHPIAIKYDRRFTDAFWDSSRYPMIQYIYMMMSSWGLVCDIWYLPPMRLEPGESAIEFADRVKNAIAEQAGLVVLDWDGGLKRAHVKEGIKKKQQENFTKRLGKVRAGGQA